MAKRLTRSHDNKVLGGVCGGISEFLGVDATWVRLATIVLALFWGIGAVVYVLLWLVLPDSSNGDMGIDGVFDFYKAHRDRPSDRA